MAQPIALFDAGHGITGNGAQDAFKPSTQDPKKGGLQPLRATIRARGTLDGASVTLQVWLGGWVDTPIVMDATNGQLIIIGPEAAPIAPKYRFNVSGAGASTELDLLVAFDGKLEAA